jgi:prolyl oligopeptidase
MWIILLLVGIVSCTSINKNKFEDKMNLDHLNYLTEISSDQVNQFIDKENKLSLDRLTKDPRFDKTYSEILSILTAKDKLPHFYFVGSEIYDFWQDDIHVRGILRKTTVEKLNSNKPDWQTVLDIDALSKAENKNWVWKGFECLEPQNEVCLLILSDGGKDARTTREYNLKTQSFVKDGFFIPESKTDATWIDKDTLYICDGTNTQTLTNSGYPTTVKKLNRGERIDSAEIVFTAEKTDVAAWLSNYHRGEKNYFILNQAKTFYSGNRFLISDDGKNKIQKIPMPEDAEFVEIYNDQFLFSNRSDFKIKDKIYKPGSVFSFSLNNLSDPKFNVVFIPTKTQFFEFAVSTKNYLMATVLDDVKKSVLKYNFKNNQWIAEKINLGYTGNTSVMAFTKDSDLVYLNYTSFLNPTEYHYLDLQNPKSLKKVMTSPLRFDAKNLIAHQYKTKSSDGTLIPYFIVHKKDLKLNGSNPTLLYGYGGFEITLTPHYLGATGKAWLEKGGVYVLANIRGGGEYGPDWHKAGLKENRQLVFNDFYAIAEDLISKKITSPKHLGIQGGSNGGLLTSVGFTQRPELFNAVISEVPLANMMDYHKWLSGNSWMAEYGNPGVPVEREYLLKYSPLHNLQVGKSYPEVFYVTSTKDDRVHPAHARQMVARMREQNHPVIYFENKDGGHASATNMTEYARLMALKYIYLFQKLF